MFGMGFTEMLLIAVIAILFLGPDKLPSTMIEIAKFFRNVKSTIGDVKNSLEEEMHVSDIKKEALAYKEELLRATEQVEKVADMPAHATSSLNAYADDILKDEEVTPPKEQNKEPQEVTFKKKKKKEETTPKEEDEIDV